MKKISLILLMVFICFSVFAAVPSFSSLNRAVSAGNVTLISRYLNQGADVNAVNSEGNTVLFTELFKDYDASAEIVEILINAGLNPNVGDYFGYAPLHYAVDYCTPEVVLALLESPIIDVDILTEYGETPLLLEVYKNYYASLEVIEKFMEKGADPSIEDENGNSALSYAQENCSDEIIIALGGKVESLDKFELSIPDWAHGEWTTEVDDKEALITITSNDILIEDSDDEIVSVSDLLNEDYITYIGGEYITENETDNAYELIFDVMGFYTMHFVSIKKTNDSNVLKFILAEEEQLTLIRKGSSVKNNILPEKEETEGINDSDNSKSSTKHNLNFPSWALGTWGGDYAGTRSLITITSDDMMINVDGVSYSVFKTLEEQLGLSSDFYTLKEDKTSDTYSVSMVIFGYTTPFFTLRRGDNSRSMYYKSAYDDTEVLLVK